MHRVLPAILLCFLSVFPLSASNPDTNLSARSAQQRERQLARQIIRSSQYAEVRHISSSPDCEDVHPPEALTTPDPLFASSARGRKIKVSFIIGVDGRVHSPLILESAGISGDRRVLQTVRTWRYRPATCNGVPTETEGKVEFSGR